jgi:predicted ATPase
VADAIQPSFLDGVCWVGLAGVAEPDHVGSTIACGRGVIPARGESVRQALTSHVADTRLLLATDNLEHVLDAAELVAELPRTSDRLKALVTCREGLVLGAEHRVTVQPLKVPAGSHVVSVAEVESTDATAPFLAAARRRDERLEVTPENAPVIARICGRLEGSR